MKLQWNKKSGEPEGSPECYHIISVAELENLSRAIRQIKKIVSLEALVSSARLLEKILQVLQKAHGA